jgi:hypothetical protein
VNTLHTEILDRLTGLFDAPLIQNNLRGLYVETLVSCLLGPHWKLVSADWSAWDLAHEDGTRLEVKQAAAKQTWCAGGALGNQGVLVFERRNMFGKMPCAGKSLADRLRSMFSPGMASWIRQLTIVM